MDIVNIVIPIVASILGGLVSGLFTYLGVKMTILNDRELKKQDIYEKNKETNKAIIQNRPELKIIDKANTINKELEIFVLPYILPKLKTKEEIIFDYDQLKINDNFWQCHEILLIGKNYRNWIFRINSI